MIDGHTDGDLRIEVVSDADSLRLRWQGKSNAREPGVTLHPFLDRVAAEAKRRSLGVEIRLNDLQYFNSSTLAAIIRGIRLFREQGTRVVISYLESSGWQRRSCEALRILEEDGLVEIRHD